LFSRQNTAAVIGWPGHNPMTGKYHSRPDLPAILRWLANENP
jgi:hypothetical protein